MMYDIAILAIGRIAIGLPVIHNDFVKNCFQNILTVIIPLYIYIYVMIHDATYMTTDALTV